VVSDVSRFDEKTPQMEALGYEAKGEFGIPGRRYFRKDDARGDRTHQIHAFQSGSPEIERHLAFRDFLRAHPRQAKRYEALKERLASLYPTDIGSYADGKDDFIKAMDAKAAAWRAMLFRTSDDESSGLELGNAVADGPGSGNLPRFPFPAPPHRMHQIVFNEISAAEMSALPKELQLDLLAEFQFLPEDLDSLDEEKFGLLERDGKRLYRYRAKDYRIYFERRNEGITVHRVLHKNTIRDFLFRTKLPMTEDDQLGQQKGFWKLIEEAEQSRRS
jgi:mRNA-degrading endonuclease RelE of RelBE toxin-antitoxin system